MVVGFAEVVGHGLSVEEPGCRGVVEGDDCLHEGSDCLLAGGGSVVVVDSDELDGTHSDCFAGTDDAEDTGTPDDRLKNLLGYDPLEIKVHGLMREDCCTHFLEDRLTARVHGELHSCSRLDSVPSGRFLTSPVDLTSTHLSLVVVDVGTLEEGDRVGTSLGALLSQSCVGAPVDCLLTLS